MPIHISLPLSEHERSYLKKPFTGIFIILSYCIAEDITAILPITLTAATADYIRRTFHATFPILQAVFNIPYLLPSPVKIGNLLAVYIAKIVLVEGEEVARVDRTICFSNILYAAPSTEFTAFRHRAVKHHDMVVKKTDGYIKSMS